MRACAQAGTPQTFEALEQSVLKGQKLQGVLTSNEVQEILKVCMPARVPACVPARVCVACLDRNQHPATGSAWRQLDVARSQPERRCCSCRPLGVLLSSC